MDEAELALCFSDVFQGTLTLARGATAIFESSFNCRQGVEHDYLGSVLGGAARRLRGEKIDHMRIVSEEFQRQKKLRCAASVTETIAALSESAAYLASSASDCIAGVQAGAYCVADAAALTGALGQVANVASIVNETCHGQDLEDDAARRLQEQRLAATKAIAGTRAAPKAISHGGARSLSERTRSFWEAWRKEIEVKEKLEEAVERAEQREHRLVVTECVLDVNQGLGALLRAGIAVNQAVEKCTADLLETDMGRRVCAVDISGAVGSFTFAAEYLSFAASHCGEALNVPAECLGDIMQLITALSSFAAVGSAMRLSCSPETRGTFDEGIPPGRRLAAGASAVLV